MTNNRDAGGARFFPGSLALSVGLHAALAAVVLVMGGLTRAPAPPVLTVSLVAPLTGAGGRSEPLGSEGAQAAPRPASPRVAPAPPPPVPVKHKAAKPKRPAKSPPLPETATVNPTPPPKAPPVARAAATAGVAASPPPPHPAAGAFSGGPGGGGGTARAGSGSGAGTAAASGPGTGQGGPGQGGAGLQIQKDYLNIVRARILAKRQYPPLSRQRRQEGTVRLRFTLMAAGTLSQDVQVVKPSGFQLLDEQARHCVLAAAPFPPFPTELKRDRLTVEVPIIYRITEEN